MLAVFIEIEVHLPLDMSKWPKNVAETHERTSALVQIKILKLGYFAFLATLKEI